VRIARAISAKGRVALAWWMGAPIAVSARGVSCLHGLSA
jgi:hypothetical protein